MSDYGATLTHRISRALNDPNCFLSAKHLVERIDFVSSPRKPAEAMPAVNKADSGAQYLMFRNGGMVKVLVLARLDMRGVFAKTDGYFNATDNKGEPREVKSSLSRLRASFELKPLQSDDHLADFFPPNAVKASQATLRALLLIQQKLKEDRKSIPDENYTTYIRSIRNENRFVLVTTTHLLMPSLKSGSDTIPALSLDDIDSEDENDEPLSPSKLLTKKASQADVDGPQKILLGDMDDPNDEYARSGAIDVEVVAPEVYNRRGQLVHPKDYGALPRDSIAIVEVSICCWEMKKHNRFVAHLRLERMNILDESITYEPTPPPSPTPAPKRKGKGVKNEAEPKKPRTRASASGSSSKAKSEESETEHPEGEMMDEDKIDL
ncbi:hypothetical protein NMY22_g14950 [Coprinellus aureogranulatus]|nr:hypothetical protein NMY22_g14950 [Coprinellus aureogranulatus]